MSVIPCQWDWCRSSFTTIDALDNHMKHDHIWPMKPMHMADIILMRKIDHRSLHSSIDTDSSIMPRGLISDRSWAKTVHQSNENNDYDKSFSPLPQSLAASRALDSSFGKVEQELSAVVETSECMQGHPGCRSPSDASGFSQDVVEQQLAREDYTSSRPRSLPPPELPSEHEHTDVELTWPTDDELNVPTTNGIQRSEQQNNHPDTSVRGQNFRYGSFDVPLGANTPQTVQQSQPHSQPLVLQTQAPYSSQSMGWSYSS